MKPERCERWGRQVNLSATVLKRKKRERKKEEAWCLFVSLYVCCFFIDRHLQFQASKQKKKEKDLNTESNRKKEKKTELCMFFFLSSITYYNSIYIDQYVGVSQSKNTFFLLVIRRVVYIKLLQKKKKRNRTETDNDNDNVEHEQNT